MRPFVKALSSVYPPHTYIPSTPEMEGVIEEMGKDGGKNHTHSMHSDSQISVLYLIFYQKKFERILKIKVIYQIAFGVFFAHY